MNKFLSTMTVLLLSIFDLQAASDEDFKLEVQDSIMDYTAYNQIKVLDMRSNKNDAGYLRLGAFNRKTILVSEGGFTSMLQHFAEQTTQRASHIDTKSLLIIVRDFSLADRPVAGEMGTFYARMDFYLGEQEHYKHVMHVDSFFETSNGWDVTKSLRRIAAQKTTNWLQQVAGRRDPGHDTAVSLTIPEIEANINQEHNAFPVYNKDQQPGIYYTLEEFLNNNPRDTAFVQKDYFMDGVKVSYFYEKQEGKKKGKSLDKVPCYAVYNGKKWYKKTSFGLLEMKFVFGDFYFSEAGYGIRATDDVAIMFGLVGALIAAGSPGKGKAVYKMRLDPVTGNGFCTARLQ